MLPGNLLTGREATVGACLQANLETLRLIRLQASSHSGFVAEP